MKNIMQLILVFFFAFSLFAQKPLVKFYLNDGSTKQYNLNEIDSLGVIDKKNNYVMRIHYYDSLVAYYPTEIIGSIKFEKDDIQRDILNVYIFSYPKTYEIISIDSITFYNDQYQPLTIGNQVWMLKNLNVDHYRTGDNIPQVTDSVQWQNLVTGAWCFFNNDSAREPILGKLYNWYSVNDSRGLAPLGWHIPTDEEWKTLEIFLGMSHSSSDSMGGRGNNEGGKLKETGLIKWSDPNTGATNETGFTALPGNFRRGNGWSFADGHDNGFWCSDQYNATMGLWRSLRYCYADIYRSPIFKNYGFSVRCVKD